VSDQDNGFIPDTPAQTHKKTNNRTKIQSNYDTKKSNFNDSKQLTKGHKMRTIETKVFEFNELSPEAKERAISDNYDINIFFDWWEFVYQDAEQVGIKITGFDIDRGSYCKIKVESISDTIDGILKNHGKQADTYKDAKNFKKETKSILQNSTIDGDLDSIHSREMEDLEKSFLHDLSENYLKILRDEYEYLTSEKAIIEAIEANSMEFKENGGRI